MDNLRLILAVLGLVVLVAVWAFESWRRRRNAVARDDPFAGLEGEDFSLDELPPWSEHAAPPSAPAADSGSGPRSRETGNPPRPGDLFDEPEEAAGELELGELPSLKASRDDDVPAEGLSGIVAEHDDERELPGPETRAKPERVATPSPPEAAEPYAGHDGDPEPREAPPTPASVADPPQAAVAPATPRTPRVISLTVMARPGRRFVGHQIRAALESVGMRYGDMQIFHYHDEDGDDEPLFSAVNVLKPGTFDLARLGELSTTGVALFMEAGSRDDDHRVFELMLDTVRHLAERLGGELADTARRPLSATRLAELRESLAGDAPPQE